MPDAQPRTGSSNGLAIYLGVLQFLLLLTWTVYAVYLPGLLESVGIARSWTGWILLADQALFACFDVAVGFLADRAFRLYARIGHWVLGFTAISCAAFLALPLLPGADAGPALFLGVTAVWVIASAALRSPLFALLARHAATPAVPRLAGLALIGMGLAAAVSPYLGTLLAEMDPRLPFALSSLTLLAVCSGILVAERRAPAEPAPETEPPRPLPAWGWIPALLLASLAFQIGVFINAGPRYLREVDPSALPWLMPVFWVAFSLLVFAAGKLGARWGAPRVFIAGCLAGATGLALTTLDGLGAAVGGYALAGLGWGSALPSAFGLAAESGRPGRTATFTGLLFATLAAAAFLRIGLNLSGLPSRTELTALVTVGPALVWLLGGLLILALIRLIRTRRQPGTGSIRA
ncbi:MFS transporter [Imhoffiella purpurea]|uniref:MFS transporter n=1 Tax=Imhoffiella purpurea TaxID=1249627 RepID=W9VBB5_9GAMM|nr:MFS transporter [Imhoffiella purpurea]EXJ16739.1 hypothetical protein D779_3416 [Imhoffiella purpurea]